MGNALSQTSSTHALWCLVSLMTSAQGKRESSAASIWWPDRSSAFTGSEVAEGDQSRQPGIRGEHACSFHCDGFGGRRRCCAPTLPPTQMDFRNRSGRAGLFDRVPHNTSDRATLYPTSTSFFSSSTVERSWPIAF